MNDDHLTGLGEEAPHPRLAGLEADVWRGVEARAAADRHVLLLGLAQGGALAVALITALSWGAMSTRPREPEEGVFSPHMALAPSSRLAERDG